MPDPVRPTPVAVLVADPASSRRDGGPDAEYAALREGALLVDRSDRSRMQFAGPAAQTTITGLVTNDVSALTPGQGLYAAALTPKGKIVADLRIFARNGGLLIDAAPRAASGWLDIVRKYVNPRLTAYTDVSGTTADCGVFGARAAEIAARALGLVSDVLTSLVPYAHIETTVAGQTITVARVPDAGVDGFEWFAPKEIQGAVWDRMIEAGATAGGLHTFEIARVEAGRPAWGLDMDESTIPQEANFDELGALSYTKGCYTGQETVARVHFRGHVNRHLRGLRLTLDGPALTPAGSDALRAMLTDVEGKEVGDVRSAVHSPRLGPIALAMVRREVPSGSTLTARWQATEDRESGETHATVVTLPFAPG
jgi:folate-binding protein YgfZ